MQFLPNPNTQLYMGQMFLFKVIIEDAERPDVGCSVLIKPGVAFASTEDISMPKLAVKNGSNYEATFSMYVNKNTSSFKGDDLKILLTVKGALNAPSSISFTKEISKSVTGINSVTSKNNSVLFTSDVNVSPSDEKKAITLSSQILVAGIPVEGYMVEWRTNDHRDASFFLDSTNVYLSNEPDAKPLTRNDLNNNGSIYQDNGETVIRTVTDKLGMSEVFLTANSNRGFAEISASYIYGLNESVGEICVIDPNAYPAIPTAPEISGFLDGVLQLDSVPNPFDAYLFMPQDASTVDIVYPIVNGISTEKKIVAKQRTIQTSVFKKLISTENENNFYYVVCDHTTGEVKISRQLDFKATGNPNVPPIVPSPDLPAPSGTSLINHNTIGLNHPVRSFLSMTSKPISNVWDAKVGDVITASVFVSGFVARTEEPKMSSDSLGPYTLTDKDVKDSYYMVSFPAYDFYGFGASSSGQDSVAYFSYTVNPVDDPTKSYISDIHKATVETVGPV